ncbi:MAG: hypothetical protein LCH54_11165 [Bacteroidetes bacterium]|nr:hypothetical protein [Bacteroidota bacterium]
MPEFIVIIGKTLFGTVVDTLSGTLSSKDPRYLKIKDEVMGDDMRIPTIADDRREMAGDRAKLNRDYSKAFEEYQEAH